VSVRRLEAYSYADILSLFRLSQVFGAWAMVSLAKDLGCAVADMHFCRNGEAVAVSEIWNVTSTILEYPVNGFKIPATVILTVSGSRDQSLCATSSTCPAPFKMGETTTMPSGEQFRGALEGIRAQIDSAAAVRGPQDGPVVAGVSCAVHFGLADYGLRRPDTALRPNDFIIAAATSFIDSRLGGRGSYIAVHARRTDFNVNCSSLPAGQEDFCSLRMDLAAVRIAQQACAKKAQHVFIASDTDRNERLQLEGDIGKAQRERSCDVSKVVWGDELKVRGHIYAQLVGEQAVLGCGSLLLRTPVSTFSIRAHQVGEILGCSPEAMRLPTSQPSTW
jgi:hypothetical protein